MNNKIPDKQCRNIVLEDINPAYVLYEDGSIYSTIMNKFLTTTKNGKFYNLLRTDKTQCLYSKDFLVKRYITKMDPLKNTEYKQIKDNENYYVTRDGRVFSTLFYKFITPCITNNGWKVVCLIINGRRTTIYVAKAVWEAFNGPLDKMYKLKFKDNNRKNCSLDNLEIEMKKCYLQNSKR